MNESRVGGACGPARMNESRVGGACGPARMNESAVGGACGPSYPDSFPFRIALGEGFTGIRAVATQWEDTTQPIGADHGPTRTVPASLSALASLPSGSRRVADSAPGVGRDRFAVGAAYGVAAAGGATATCDAGRAARFHRTPLAPHPGAHRMGYDRHFRSVRARQCAPPATWAMCAAAGRYAADRPVHVEHAGAGLWRPCTATGVVPLGPPAPGQVLAANR